MPSPNTPSPPVCPGTLRIWVIGFYIVEYEQEGKDRAAYGKRLLETIAKRLSDRGVKGLSLRPLRSCRAFYLTFPQIRLTVSAEFNLIENVSNKMNLRKLETKPDIALIDPKILLSKLNFSHFEELLKLDTPPPAHLLRSPSHPEQLGRP